MAEIGSTRMWDRRSQEYPGLNDDDNDYDGGFLSFALRVISHGDPRKLHSAQFFYGSEETAHVT